MAGPAAMSELPLRAEKDRLLRPDQVASRLNISRAAAYRLIADGHFTALKIGASLRVTEQSVEDYVRRQIEVFILES
jgi:excisionase family DNA binding protein